MQIVDLSQPLYDQMPVYPGDPKVSIKQALTLAKDGWNMNVISLPAHIATHVNVPIHAVEGGKSLDDYPVDAFYGSALIFQSLEDIKTGMGILFEQTSLPDDAVQKIIEVKAKFVGVQGYFESESELEKEKLLLRNGVISYEGLVNVDKLPKNKPFTFYGIPLKIRSGDGSPVRAFAEIE